MENRFGIKDFFLFLVLGAIVTLLILCVVQYDRQWDEIKKLQSQTSSLANDLNRISNRINSGAVATAVEPGNAAAADPMAVPFSDIAEMRSKPDFAEGDWMVENFGTNIGKLTPLISTDVYATWVQTKVMETLGYRDLGTLKWKPLLATDWKVSDDGKQITVHLRDNVVFSDGTPLTSEDVAFTFNHILNPEIDAARSATYIKHLESIETPDARTAIFKFKEFKFNTFSSVMDTGIMSKKFYSKYTPREYNETPGLLIGSGPYRLATPDGWHPGQQVELVRNERYWGGPPAFNKVVYYEVKDDVAEETMYRNRELDRLAPPPDAFEKLKLDTKITERSNAYQYYSPVSGYTFLGWNQRRKLPDQDAFKATIFADKRVRQAMTMLVNRDQLARDLYVGHAKPAVGPFGFGTAQSDPEIKPMPFDVAKAKALLKEAGFEDRNGDGTIDSPDGKPMEFTLSYGSGNPFTDRIVLFLKDSFASAGITMKLDAVDWPILLKKLDNRDFDVCTLGWSTGVETDCNQIFHSSATRDQGDNFISYVNPELDKAIDDARGTVSEEQRMLAWRAVHRIIHEDQPYTFLLNREICVFLDKRIKNVKQTKLGLNMVLTEMTPFPWYVPASEQLHKTQN